MSILVKPNTKVLVPGIPGGFGAKHAQLPIDCGTQAAGVTPGRGGQSFEHGGKRVPIQMERDNRRRAGGICS